MLLAVGCAIVVSLLVLSYTQSELGLRAVANVEHHTQLLSELDHLQMQLTDAETGVRGYRLTGDETYLDPYLAGVSAIPHTVESLVQRFSGMPEAQAPLTRLLKLTSAKLDVMRRAVESTRRGEKTSYIGEGKQLMDQIREDISSLKSDTAVQGRASIEQSLLRFSQTRISVIVLSGGALVLLLMLFSATQRQLQLREQIAELLRTENERLDRLVQSRTEALSNLASYLTEVREVEKSRLARELHDELGATLTAAKMDAGWIRRKLEGEALIPLRDRVDRLISMLDSGIALKRRVIDDLRPPLLKDLGLVEALRALAEQFCSDTRVPTEIQLPETDIAGIGDAQSLALFRIAQEAFTNIRKYANATHVGLKLSVEDDVAQLRIEDNGRGFDAGEDAFKSTHGIIGMRHRVQMFAGKFTVASRPGVGTRIVAKMPLSRSASAAAERP